MSPGGVIIALVLGCLHTLETNGFDASAAKHEDKQISSHCKVQCEIQRGFLDISYYKIENNPLKNYVYACEVTGEVGNEIARCDLDLRDVTTDTPADFVARAAVVVKCLIPAEVRVVNPSRVKIRTLSLLELRYCAVSWSSVASFGKALGLRGLRLFQPLYVINDLPKEDFIPTVIPVNHIFPPIVRFDRTKYSSTTMINGLETLGQLEIQNPTPCGENRTYLHCFNPGRKAMKTTNLPSIFVEHIWPEMAELALRGMNLTAKDITPLPDTMPFLQSLNIYRNTEIFESFPQFPWCSNNMFLPLAMSRTDYGIEMYNNGLDIPQNLHRRFLVLDFSTRQPARTLAVKLEGALDKISFNNTKVDFGSRHPSPFEGAFGLQILQLTNDRITGIPGHAFAGNSRIKRIDLSNNHIMFIGRKAFLGHRFLKHLLLAKNKICDISSDIFSDLVNLEELDLSYNCLETIESGTFVGMTKLVKLSLNNNRIRSIERGSLPDMRSNQLSQLDLGNNQLKTLHPDIILFEFASIIDLSDNGITSRDFMGLLEDLNPDVVNDVMSASPNYTYSEAVVFSIRGTHVVLSLANNLIDNIDIKRADSPEGEALDLLLSYFKLDLTGNPLNCDCNAFPLYNLTKKDSGNSEYKSFWLSYEREDTWICTKPYHLKGRPLVDITEDEFECPFTGGNCPGPCECSDRLTKDIYVVDCHARNLTSLPDVMPEGLLELHFEDNQITDLPPRPYLSNVTALHIGRNNIENITVDVVELLSANVKIIHLQDNKIERITENVTTLLSNITELNLLQNALICNCGSKWIRDWLSQANYFVRARDMKCIVGNDSKEILTLTADDFSCPVSSPVVQVIAGAAAGTILLLLFVGVFVLPAILKGRRKGEKLRTEL